jgi:hypothetical protein
MSSDPDFINLAVIFPWDMMVRVPPGLYWFYILIGLLAIIMEE